MQLLKVQERINALPHNPASLAYLDRAAKGMDTEIPPFMALAGMNEMKRNMEYASTGQPPEEPINQSLPKQVAQKMGLGQPMQPGQQMQPGQPMQPFGQQLAQGIAQPMLQQMPQQMAGGGLASIRIDPRMFDYGSGGVVSFAQAGRVFAPSGRFGNADSDQIDPTVDDGETSAEEAAARRKELEARYDALTKEIDPNRQTAIAIEAERRKVGNYGVDEGPLGKEYLTGLAQIQELKKAERARQAEDNKSRDYLGIGNALIAAGNATRGQSGMGAFLGGFGQQAGQEMMASQQRDAALRGQGIAEEDFLNEAKNKLQALRQAKLSGDVAKEVELQHQLADLANKARTAQYASLAAQITAMSRIVSAGIAADKGTRPTDLAGGVEEGLRAARARGDKRNDDVIREEVRNRLITAGVATTAAATIAGQTSQAATATSAQDLTEDQHNTARRDLAIDNVDKRLADFRNQFARELRRLQREDQAFNNPPTPLIGDAPPKPAVRQDKAGEYREKLYEKEYEKLPPFRRATSGTPAPGAAAAPAAASAAPPANLLKPGINTNFDNGQTWTLGADGKPQRVK